MKKKTIPKNKGGRPSKIDEFTIKKLEEALKIGSSVTQACIYAGISVTNFYDWCKIHKGFLERMEAAKNFPYVFAKSKIFESMRSKDLNLASKNALEFLKRKDPERKDKVENTVNQISFTGITIEDATGEKTNG